MTGSRRGAIALCLLATAAAAAAGAVGSVRAPEFYAELAKPAWAPPGSVFGPVWTVLYLAMGVASWLVIRARGWPGARPAVALYLTQLAFNALWTWLFFVWRMGAAAAVEIVLLWILVLLTTRAFYRARPLAGALLLPYLAWIAFASALTWAVWRRNLPLL